MWRLNTKLRSEMLQATQTVPHAIAGTTFGYANNGGGSGIDRITDSANGFVTAGFEVEDYVTVIGSTGNTGKTGRTVAVAAGYLDVIPSGVALVTEGAGVPAIVAAASGGSVAGIFKNGVIRIYTGAQPSTADAAETGTLLCELSVASGTFVPGSPENGITFGQVVAGILGKATNEVWSGVNVATGTAGWFRIYANDRTLGVSTTTSRLDGACATSGAQMNMSSTALVQNITTTIDGVQLNMPAA